MDTISQTEPPADETLASSLPAAALPPALPKLLTPDEEKELELCEQIIERGKETFLEVGIAITTIRDRRLYRVEFDTFEEWSQARMGVTARRMRQLCGAAEVMRNVRDGLASPGADGNPGSYFLLPASEALCRPLLGLPPEEQRAAWLDAVQTAPNGRPTRAHVQAVVRARRGTPAVQAIAGAGEEKPPEKPIKGHQVRDADVNEPKGVRLREAADRAIAAARELVDLAGTADSAKAAYLRVALEHFQDYKDHLGDLGRMHAARI